MRRRIQTTRLSIEELPPNKATQVAAFHRDNWHFHSRWEPSREATYFTAKMQQKILRHERRAPDVVHFWLLLKEPLGGLPARQVVGSVTLSAIVRGFLQSCSLGYKIDSRVARRGLTREALRAVLDFAFNTEGLHRVEANVVPENGPSRRLLESLGFTVEGIARRYLRIQGVWTDHVHMVMLSEDWAT